MASSWLLAASLLGAFAGCGSEDSSSSDDGAASGSGGSSGASGPGDDGGAGEANGGTGGTTGGSGASGGATGNGGSAGEAIGGGGGEGGASGDGGSAGEATGGGGGASGGTGGDCTPGAARCNGPQPETCDNDGQWQSDGPACSGTTPVCTTGGCEPCPGGACGWIRQFGTDTNDTANDVVVDPSGNILVVGKAKGTLAGTDPLGNAFVRKYDPSGTELWTRVFRAGTSTLALGVAVDENGNVFVGGVTEFGAFPGETAENYGDAFIRKYDASGTEQWTRQFGTDGSDFVQGVAVDSNGNVLVTGLWSGTISDIFTGEESVLFRKYDASGNHLFTQNFGTSEFDNGYDVAVAESGNVYVAGKTHGMLQTSPGGAFVRKFDASGMAQWTRQFGVYRGDEVRGVGVDGSENVYVGGTIELTDAVVRKYDASGTEQWTRQFGSTGSDQGTCIAVDESGNSYIVGTTNGTFPGQSSAGDYDVFVTKHSASGGEEWTLQLGTNALEFMEDVAVDSSGAVYMVGATRGTFPGQTSAGLEDAFLVRIVP